jgi:hypothetical protein
MLSMGIVISETEKSLERCLCVAWLVESLAISKFGGQSCVGSEV